MSAPRRVPHAQPGVPDVYAEDFSAAVDFFCMQPLVDRERIGVLGICGSGSFVISAAKIDPCMRAVATLSMYDMGAASRDGLRQSQTGEQREQAIAAAAQRDVEFGGDGDSSRASAASSTVMSSAMPTLPNATAALRASPRRFARVTGEPLNAALNDGWSVARSARQRSRVLRA